MRIGANLTDSQRERVKDYADEKELKMSRAYAGLIPIGLDEAPDGDGDG